MHRLLHRLALAALLPAALGAQPREIATITVFPAARTMTAGDTLRLTAEARDASGARIPGVTFRYRLGPSARFEGAVDSTGLVTASSTAILPVTVTATHLRRNRAAMPDVGAPILAVKAVIDGLVDAGVLPDDGPDIVRRLTFEAPEIAGFHGLRVVVREVES